MIYPKLINWWKWRYDYLKKQKENGKWNPREEKPCYKIVDVVYKTFWRKDYFVKLSQSQKGHIYFIVRKKGGRLIEEEKDALHKKYSKFLQVFLIGTVTNITVWVKIISLAQNWSRTLLGTIFIIFWSLMIKMVTNVFEHLYFVIFGNFVVCFDYFFVY